VSHFPCRRGFTLIELLVVLGIIAVLIGLLLPAIQKVRETSYRANCQSNLRQLGIATQSFHDTMCVLPPAYSYFPIGHNNPATNFQAPTMVWLLPFLEEKNLFEAIVAQNALDTPTNYNGQSPTLIKIFQCPSDATLDDALKVTGDTEGSFANYACNGLVFGSARTTVAGGVPTSSGWSGKGANTLANITDGTSNTIFWIEKVSYCSTGAVGYTRWAGMGGNATPIIGSSLSPPDSLPPLIQAQFNVRINTGCVYYWPSSSHTNTIQACLGDGSVRALDSEVSKVTLNIALVPNDDLALGTDW
jgi:prepilin-type N-terminal cleavage/methylation domain-containing protein